MTSMVNFSSYSLSDGKSFTPPNNPEARAYSACTASNLPAIIIDSGTTSHIHSDCANFKSLKLSSSGSINGFGDGSRTIQGRVKPNFMPSYQPVASLFSSYRVHATCQTPHPPHPCSSQSLALTKRIVTPYSVMGSVLLSRIKIVANSSTMC